MHMECIVEALLDEWILVSSDGCSYFWMNMKIKKMAKLFKVCNKQNVSVHKSLWPAVQVVQREIYCHRMENPCSRENAMNINIASNWSYHTLQPFYQSSNGRCWNPWDECATSTIAKGKHLIWSNSHTRSTTQTAVHQIDNWEGGCSCFYPS